MFKHFESVGNVYSTDRQPCVCVCLLLTFMRFVLIGNK